MERESGLDVIRRYWWVITIFTVVGVLVGAVPSPARAADRSVSYSATHTLLLSSTNGNLFSDPVALNQIQLFATRGEVRSRAAAKLNLSEGEVNVSPSLDQTTGALSITATEADPDRAVAIADTVADELTKYILERQDNQREDRLAASLQRQHELEDKIRDLEQQVAAAPDDNVKSAQLDAARNQYVVVLQQYDALSSDESGLLQLNTLEKASPVEIVSQGLSAPRSRWSRGLLLGLLGCGLGLAVAFVLARVDRQIRTRSQAESVLGLRAQVSIPAADADSLAGLAVTSTRHDALSDSYRSLRSVVEFAEAGAARAKRRGPIIVVVSPTPGDGKTSVSSNLAAAFVESGRKTIAVNADFRRPAMAERILGESLAPMTLTFEELNDAPSRSLLTRTPTTGLALVDVSSVKASPGDLARVTARVVTELAPMSEAIVVDTSPMTATAEVLELIPLADVVLMITRLDRTPAAAASRAVETLRAMEPPHLLLVVVGENVDRSSYYYNYSGSRNGKTRPWKRHG